MFDPKIGLILMFDLDLGLIPTKIFMQQGPGKTNKNNNTQM